MFTCYRTASYAFACEMLPLYFGRRLAMDHDLTMGGTGGGARCWHYFLPKLAKHLQSIMISFYSKT
jgi:hypothetical protein